MNKYFKNAILCGEIDFHCLLCEETFHYAADLDLHVRWENHRKKLKTISYNLKFNGNCISKIGVYYYCELCNIVLPTDLKTRMHTYDEKHIANKENPTLNAPVQSLVSRDAGKIKISNIIVNEKEWNGIVDDQCIICDKDFVDVEAHITETEHVINLIQSKVEMQDPEHIYRKVEKEIVYCFLCKAPLPSSSLEKHWTSKEHCEKKKNIAAKIVNNGASTSSFSEEFKTNMKKMFVFSDTSNKPKKNERNPINNSDIQPNNNSDILLRLQEFQNGGIDVNFERSSAVCKVCKFILAFTAEAIEGHIKMHKVAEKKDKIFIGFAELAALTDISDDDDDDDDDDVDSPDSDFDSIGGDTTVEETEQEIITYTGSAADFVKMKAALREFGKKNSMKMIADNTKGYCTLCDVKVSAHMKNFIQHVKGARHVTNMKAKKSEQRANQQRPNEQEYKTKNLQDYLRNIFFVKHVDDFWVNRKYCIDKHSFFMVCAQEENGKYERMKCFICNEMFPIDKDQAHCERMQHKNKMFTTKVVTSLKKEFVREIRPNTFHCGFCNDVSMSWALLKRHLKTNKHREIRQEQEFVADMTNDMYGMEMEDTNSAETDIMWMQLMGNRLF